MSVVYISLDVILTGERIHNVMMENGYSVKDIQKILGLSHPQPIYRWLHGCCIPSTDNLYKLSKIFNMHMEELLIEVGAGDKMQ